LYSELPPEYGIEFANAWHEVTQAAFGEKLLIMEEILRDIRWLRQRPHEYRKSVTEAINNLQVEESDLLEELNDEQYGATKLYECLSTMKNVSAAWDDMLENIAEIKLEKLTIILDDLEQLRTQTDTNSNQGRGLLLEEMGKIWDEVDEFIRDLLQKGITAKLRQFWYDVTARILLEDLCECEHLQTYNENWQIVESLCKRLNAGKAFIVDDIKAELQSRCQLIVGRYSDLSVVELTKLIRISQAWGDLELAMRPFGIEFTPEIIREVQVCMLSFDKRLADKSLELDPNQDKTVRCAAIAQNMYEEIFIIIITSNATSFNSNRESLPVLHKWVINLVCTNFNIEDTDLAGECDGILKKYLRYSISSNCDRKRAEALLLLHANDPAVIKEAFVGECDTFITESRDLGSVKLIPELQCKKLAADAICDQQGKSYYDFIKEALVPTYQIPLWNTTILIAILCLVKELIERSASSSGEPLETVVESIKIDFGRFFNDKLGFADLKEIQIKLSAVKSNTQQTPKDQESFPMLLSALTSSLEKLKDKVTGTPPYQPKTVKNSKIVEGGLVKLVSVQGVLDLLAQNQTELENFIQTGQEEVVKNLVEFLSLHYEQHWTPRFKKLLLVVSYILKNKHSASIFYKLGINYCHKLLHLIFNVERSYKEFNVNKFILLQLSEKLLVTFASKPNLFIYVLKEMSKNLDDYSFAK